MRIKFTFKIWILIILILIALIAIFGIPPKFLEKGVVVKSINKDFSEISGIVSGEIIKEINGVKIENIEDYQREISKLNSEIDEVEIKIKTNSGVFNYKSKTLDFDIENLTLINVRGNALKSGLKDGMLLKEINNYSINNSEDFLFAKSKIEPKIKVKIKTNKKETIFLISAIPEMTVANVEKTNIRMGLDLKGGARALVKPEKKLTDKEFDDLLSVIRNRLNVYGLTDINIRKASDLSGNKYMLVELAGATPKDLKDLVAKQGKFETKIGNETVFIGGKKDITFVCKDDPKCAFIRECNEIENGYMCRFDFRISLSAEAAKKHANITSKLDINKSIPKYLEKTLDLYLDDKLVDSLFISTELRGKEATDISISGPGYGATKQEAYKDAEKNMKKLQTILITGSLPFKLKIEKLDTISPLLGKEFLRNILITALLAIVGVCIVVFLRYKKIAIVLPIILTMISEILLILGFAALIKWNLDLVAIAGIIAAIGTGVDDQVVIVDETKSKMYGWKQRVKRAFFIILGAYATTLVALLPLGWAGAGLLKGFAITTIAGITFGVFITRPAFADLMRKIVKE